MAGTNLLVKKRQLVVLLIFTLFVFLLIVRVGVIQIVQGEELQRKAFEQHNLGRVISPRRGTIYDRNGKPLAISASAETVWVNPVQVRESEKSLSEIAEGLSQILDMKREDVLKKLERKTRYEIIKAKIDEETGEKVRRWLRDNKVAGINVDEDTKRYYPNANLASHVIGFTGIDNQGLDGIEKVMEEYLKGVPGRILSELDVKGNAMPFSTEKRIEPQDGLNVVLTIDETIQYFATKALEEAIVENKVERGAVAIVMDPRNGDILALVSKPDYDLNNPRAAPPGADPSNWNGYTSEDVNMLSSSVWRNKAIADTYEPGSTFKAITTAAALEENVVTPDTPTDDFPVKVGGWTINCWRHTPHGALTFKEGVYNSCNPVFVKVAQSLGINRFYNYMKAFGFYDRTGIELPGETKGVFHPEPSETDMAVASFGQRFTITPIQLITAYSSIANGGTLVKPRLVKELTDSEGNIVKKFEPQHVRKVISEQTSKAVLDILEGVVTIGTGKNAYVKGYKVGGKTGTSETTEASRYIASFCAIAPTDNPVVTVLVVLDDPKGHSHMGGVIAAPVAGRLLEDILVYLGVERRYTEEEIETMNRPVYVPDVKNKTVKEAGSILKEYGLEYRVEGDDSTGDSIVVAQTPKHGATIPEKSVVILYTYRPEQETEVIMPDLLNKTIDEATKTLKDIGLNIHIEGMGVVVRQEIEPGEKVKKGSVIEVEFRHIDNIE